MTRVVIDTNVLVSALINRAGKPGVILALVYSGEIKPLVSRQMLREYRDVLTRPKFRFASEEVKNITGYFNKIVFDMPEAGSFGLTVPADDAVFAAAAVFAKAEYLITGNKKHFSEIVNAGFSVVTPAEFLTAAGIR